MKKLKIIVRSVTAILLLVVLLNMLTFLAANLILGREHFQKCDLEVARMADSGEVMNYLIAGFYSQPGPSFSFLWDSLTGGITFANFRMSGWSAKLMAEEICRDITDNNYRKIRVLTISVGDHVARYLEEMLDNRDLQLEIIAINPCSEPVFLNSHASLLANSLTPVARLGCYLTGWASTMPTGLMRAQSGNYSLALMTDQATQLLDRHTPNKTERTIGVIISGQDEFLDGARIREYFQGAQIVYLPGIKHADTFANGEIYRDAVLEILQYSQLS